MNTPGCGGDPTALLACNPSVARLQVDLCRRKVRGFLGLNPRGLCGQHLTDYFHSLRSAKCFAFHERDLYDLSVGFTWRQNMWHKILPLSLNGVVF